MNEYTISALIQIVQNGLAEENSQEAAGMLLLNSIATQENVLVDVDSKMISNLVKRKKEVHGTIKMASARPEVIAETIKYFSEKVLPKLNPHIQEDTFQKIIALLKNDPDVPIAKCNELIALHDVGKLSEFLAMAFLYAVNRPNVRAEKQVEHTDMPLISEVSNECPICHLPLIKYVRKQSVKKYEIVSIFPDDLEPAEEAAFRAAMAPPARLDTNDNKIALCQNCAEGYMISPTVEEYVSLRELKKRYVASYKLRQEIAELDLEEEIQDVIQELAGLKSTKELEQLPLDVLRIDEKIDSDNAPLRHDITENVLTYYKFIEGELSDTGRFDVIASEISLTYEKLAESGNSQDEIFNALADWVLQATQLGQKYYLASRLVVAFFVQNCEVFHAVS